MANITEYFIEIWTSLKGNWIWVFYILLIFLIILIIISVIRNRITYIYPVRIFRVRENNKVIEKNCKGGYIGRKNSAPFFRIKFGWFPWQYIDLTTTPKPEYMDEQNRVYYKQIDVGTFVQLKREFNPNSKVIMTPVESDVKYGAILSIQRIREVLRQESTWKKIAPYMALVLIFIAAILGWWFVMDSKCPGMVS